MVNKKPQPQVDAREEPASCLSINSPAKQAAPYTPGAFVQPNQSKDAVLVVALDVPTFEEAVTLAKKFSGLPVWMKIGLELFTACGKDIVSAVRALGFPVFLDLKFHDIPHTVAKAVASAAKLDVGLVTLHASGGRKMLQAASEVCENLRQKGLSAPLLLGVTVLTSQGPEELGLDDEGLRSLVLERALLSQTCGLNGVVCSGYEAAAIKDACGENFVCLCPGIRFAGATAGHDQVRIMTPDRAAASGADFVVMGRPLREASNPVEAAREALRLLER